MIQVRVILILSFYFSITSVVLCVIFLEVTHAFCAPSHYCIELVVSSLLNILVCDGVVFDMWWLSACDGVVVCM